MFGSKKHKIQVRSVEDFLRGEDARIPASETKRSISSNIPQHVKLYMIQGVVLLFVIALVLVAFSQLSTVKSQIAELEAGKEGEASVLKTQVGELAMKLERSNGEVALLAETVAALKNDLEAEKAERAKVEKARAERAKAEQARAEQARVEAAAARKAAAASSTVKKKERVSKTGGR